MSRSLEFERARLRDDVLDMAAAVQAAIDRAVQALLDGDPAQAAAVVAGDDAIDRRDTRLEAECLRVLALHQPVAADLRLVAAVFRVNTALERMADLAADIAGRVPVRPVAPSEG